MKFLKIIIIFIRCSYGSTDINISKSKQINAEIVSKETLKQGLTIGLIYDIVGYIDGAYRQNLDNFYDDFMALHKNFSDEVGEEINTNEFIKLFSLIDSLRGN